MKLFNRKNRQTKGLDIINSHCGKKRVYETYLRFNPEIADKYLKFISKNVDAVYISWDKERKGFIG